MKTYRELEVGDMMYVLTIDLMIEKTVILAITQWLDYVQFELINVATNKKYIKFVTNDSYANGTHSWSTATNLRDVKKMKADRIAVRNRRIRYENIRKP